MDVDFPENIRVDRIQTCNKVGEDLSKVDDFPDTDNRQAAGKELKVSNFFI